MALHPLTALETALRDTLLRRGTEFDRSSTELEDPRAHPPPTRTTRGDALAMILAQAIVMRKTGRHLVTGTAYDNAPLLRH